MKMRQNLRELNMIKCKKKKKIESIKKERMWRKEIEQKMYIPMMGPYAELDDTTWPRLVL